MDGLARSADVTSEGLGMEDYVGCEPVDYAARILSDNQVANK